MDTEDKNPSLSLALLSLYFEEKERICSYFDGIVGGEGFYARMALEGVKIAI